MTYPGQYPGMAPTAPQMPTGLAAPTGGGESLSPRNLIGRACALIVRRYDPNAEYGGNRRPSVMVDIYVIDGDGPVLYGDKQRPVVTPPTMSMALPAFFSNVIMSGGWADHVGQYAGTDQPVGGRWRYGDRTDKGSPAIMFVELGGDLDTNKPAAGAATTALLDLIKAHRSGQWTPPQPVPLMPANGAPAPGMMSGTAPQVNYGPPPTAPTLPQAPSLPAAPTLPAAPVMPEGWAEGLRGHGWTPEVWAQHYPAMPPDQRAQWAALAAQA